VSDSARRAAEHTRLRRLGYRLLPGDGFSYLLHMRPREWPIMIAHTTLGFVLALGVGATMHGTRFAALLGGLAVWVVLLNGGTLAINSAFDNDEGDIGYLDAPPPPPARLAVFGFALMAAGQGIAVALPRGFAIAYAICFAMSLLYSVPPVRLKAVAGADWIINMVGFGALTPYAGWALTQLPLSRAGAWALVGFAPLFAALYPLTQLYQLEEDRARGDRTLALVLGLRWSLAVSIGAVMVAFACFAKASALSHTAARGAPALLALGVAAAAWMVVLLPWIIRASGLSPAAHKRGMYAALGAWALTDAAVLIALR
jgi:1,4-dihydroxy-2-naphthoate octaprenyltransferase